MEPTRRFDLSVSCELDFPTVRSGRVTNRLWKVHPPQSELFMCVLESGFIAAAPKVSTIHLKLLASDTESIAREATRDGRLVWTAVRFDATRSLDASDDEVSWRMFRAGLLGLLEISERLVGNRRVSDSIRATHSAVPTMLFPTFPRSSDEQYQLFCRHALYSKGKNSGTLVIELGAPKNHQGYYDFQPVFDGLTETLARSHLGSWIGDSGNDIEFSSRNLRSAQAIVKTYLETTFPGSFTITPKND